MRHYPKRIVTTTRIGGISMKRVLALLVVAMLVFAGVAVAGMVAPGPAPNAGDGVSDGSGLDPAPAGPGKTPGPAPNSGDGIPDGPGW
jgi:hypothetical protein